MSTLGSEQSGGRLGSEQVRVAQPPDLSVCLRESGKSQGFGDRSPFFQCPDLLSIGRFWVTAEDQGRGGRSWSGGNSGQTADLDREEILGDFLF